MENCECNIKNENDPKELKQFIQLTTAITENYRKATVENIKKRGTAARKDLMELKKLCTDMRKNAIIKHKPSE